MKEEDRAKREMHTCMIHNLGRKTCPSEKVGLTKRLGASTTAPYKFPTLPIRSLSMIGTWMKNRIESHCSCEQLCQ